jgi:phage gp46-like protein
MMQLTWEPRRGAADIARTATGAVADDSGLATSVILSLFCDRRADADDELPEPAGLDAKRGWVGDALALGPSASLGDRIGSRLWLLSRAKQTDETLRLAEDYAREALDWLVTDGLAADVAIVAEWIARGVLALGIQVTPADGDPALRFDFALRTA